MYCRYFTGYAQSETHIWTVQDKKIMYDNTIVNLKGVNWYGYEETTCPILGGSKIRQWDSILESLKQERYNALRIPFSFDSIENWNTVISRECYGYENQWLEGHTIRTSMHQMFQKSLLSNIAIVLDFHRINDSITPLPWSSSVTKQDIFFMWKKVIEEFNSYPNFMGIDIKNEPHGDYSWKEWAFFCREFIQYVQQTVPHFKKIIFIEGVQDHNSCWGGSFKEFMKQTSHNSVSIHNFFETTNIVFSPHVYGPSVRGNDVMYENREQWNEWFGDLTSMNVSIVIGEIGGTMNGLDFIWHQSILLYLQEKEIRNIFYWCLNPDSSDTNGLFENDWKTFSVNKLEFHKELQPFPTLFYFEKIPMLYDVTGMDRHT